VRYAALERNLGKLRPVPGSNIVDFEVIGNGVRAQQEVVLPAFSSKTANAVRQLKASVPVYDFRLYLQYFGPDFGPGRGEGISSLYVTTASVDIDGTTGTAYLFISKLRAMRIVDHLAELGFFDRAKEVDAKEAPPAARIPAGPTYVLTAPFIKNNKAYCYYLDLGWNLRMLRFLDALRKGLVGEEAKAMDEVLARLGPERKKWQAAKEAETSPAEPSAPAKHE
jgi:hypothetical protein